MSAEHARVPSELAPTPARITELDAGAPRPSPNQTSPVEAHTEPPAAAPSHPLTGAVGETEESPVARHAELEEKRQRLLQLQRVEEEQEVIRQRLSVFQQGRTSVQRHEMS